MESSEPLLSPSLPNSSIQSNLKNLAFTIGNEFFCLNGVEMILLNFLDPVLVVGGSCQTVVLPLWLVNNGKDIRTNYEFFLSLSLDFFSFLLSFQFSF
jgi:hypothetical protein